MLRRVALALAIATTIVLPSSGGSAATDWAPLSTAPVVNFGEPALARTGDGVLHVLWVQEDGENSEDLWQTTISPEGSVAPASAILTDWSSMWGGGGDIAPTSDGRLMYFFGGLKGTDHGNMSMLTSDAAGTSWELYPGDVVAGRDGPAYASTVGAGAALDGTPFQAFGGTVHRGTDEDTPSVRVHDSLESGCCAYESDVATEQSSGRVFFAWYSNADDRYGVWVHELDPATAALVGGPMAMPGVTEASSPGGPESSSDADARIPITARPGKDGVFVAHTGGYPFTKRVLVWRVGEADPIVVASTEELRSHNDPAIAADPSGRLWVAWSKGELLYFRRSNPDANRWGRVVKLRPPDGTRSIFDLKLNAQDSAVDVVANFDTDSGSPTFWHSQVEPGMSIDAPRRVRGGATVLFGVTDAGEPLEGVALSAAGRSATTDAGGEARLRVGPYRRSRTITVVATKEGFNTARVKIRVRARSR